MKTAWHLTAREREILESVLEVLGDAKAFFDSRDAAKAHEQLVAMPDSSPLALRLDAEIEALASLLGVGSAD